MPNNDWVNRTTKEHLSRMSPGDMGRRFGISFVDANGHAVSNTEWIFNPDLAAVEKFSVKYWIITGDVVGLLPQAEREAIDVAESTVQRDATADQLDLVEDLLRGLALTILDEINVLRSQHSLAPRTLAQLKTAIRGKLGN